MVPGSDASLEEFNALRSLMPQFVTDIILWYSLGVLTGIYIGVRVALKLIKFNPGPMMRIIEEHGISAYKEPTL